MATYAEADERLGVAQVAGQFEETDHLAPGAVDAEEGGVRAAAPEFHERRPSLRDGPAADGVGELLNGGRPEQVGGGQADPEGPLDLREEQGRRQGIPARQEEVVAGVHGFTTQHPAPDC